MLTSEEYRLLSASINNQLNVDTQLITKDTNVNIQDEYGNTPLFYALQNNNLQLVKLLLDNGANVNKKNKYKDTPFETALRDKHFELVKLLIEYGSDTTDSLYSVPLPEDINTVCLLASVVDAFYRDHTINLQIPKILSAPENASFIEHRLNGKIASTTIDEQKEAKVKLQKVAKDEKLQNFKQIFSSLIANIEEREFKYLKTEVSKGKELSSEGATFYASALLSKALPITSKDKLIISKINSNALLDRVKATLLQKGLQLDFDSYINYLESNNLLPALASEVRQVKDAVEALEDRIIKYKLGFYKKGNADIEALLQGATMLEFFKYLSISTSQDLSENPASRLKEVYGKLRTSENIDLIDNIFNFYTINPEYQQAGKLLEAQVQDLITLANNHKNNNIPDHFLNYFGADELNIFNELLERLIPATLKRTLQEITVDTPSPSLLEKTKSFILQKFQVISKPWKIFSNQSKRIKDSKSDEAYTEKHAPNDQEDNDNGTTDIPMHLLGKQEESDSEI